MFYFNEIYRRFESYNKLITYMNEMFIFLPNIIHSDLDIALAKAIKNTQTQYIPYLKKYLLKIV